MHRDEFGYTQVAKKDTDPGVRTMVGMGIGAAAGGVAGLTADAVKADEHDQAAYETSFVLQPGKSAVIAEISEDWTTPVDTVAKRFGGTIYRRARSDINNDSWNYDYPGYLYPYDYAS